MLVMMPFFYHTLTKEHDTYMEKKNGRGGQTEKIATYLQINHKGGNTSTYVTPFFFSFDKHI